MYYYNEYIPFLILKNIKTIESIMEFSHNDKHMNKMNIVIPMAGLGSRFAEKGFKNIKPLIPLNGKTFIEWSVESVDFKNIETTFIFVILEEHSNILHEHLKKIKPDCIILSVPKLTRGAVETALTAEKYIDNDEPLVITNSDQIFEWDKDKYIEYLSQTQTHADVIVVNADTDKFSYIQLDENNYGTKLAEKEVISDNALVGIHYWRKGKYFVDSGKELIKRDIRSKNEYYISLSYNLLIENNIKVTCYKLGPHEKYLSVGTPEQVYDYLDYKGLNVEVFKLENFFHGWFIGDFEPSILKNTGVELAIMHKKKGKDINNYHYHEDCIEINAVVKGKFLCNNKLIQENDIFVFNKNVPSICEFLEDCTFVVFKNKPSTTDKVLM
jgi:choline kinase